MEKRELVFKEANHFLSSLSLSFYRFFSFIAISLHLIQKHIDFMIFFLLIFLFGFSPLLTASYLGDRYRSNRSYNLVNASQASTTFSCSVKIFQVFYLSFWFEDLSIDRCCSHLHFLYSYDYYGFLLLHNFTFSFVLEIDRCICFFSFPRRLLSNWMCKVYALFIDKSHVEYGIWI